MSAIRVHVARYKDRTNLVLWYVDPITEKRITRSAGTANEREAERAASAWEADILANRNADTRLTWEDFRDRIEDEKLPGLADRTRSSYATVLNSIENHLAPKRLAAVADAAGITAYVKSLREKKHPKPLSDTTIEGYLRHLHELLTWAKEHGLIHAVPAFPKIRTGKRNAAMRGRPVTGEEFDRLVQAVPDVCDTYTDIWQQYLRGLWWSGLRLSESIRVSWNQDEPFCCDLSGSHPMFRIYAEGQKSRRDQLHPMAPEFAEFLESQWPQEKRIGPLFLLPHPKTGRLLTAVYDVSKVVRDIGQAAGVIVKPNVYASAHDLRRSFGLRWARRVKVHVLRAMMRHRSIETTMGYYVREAANDMAAEIWSSVPNASTDPSTNADLASLSIPPQTP